MGHPSFGGSLNGETSPRRALPSHPIDVTGISEGRSPRGVRIPLPLPYELSKELCCGILSDDDDENGCRAGPRRKSSGIAARLRSPPTRAVEALEQSADGDQSCYRASFRPDVGCARCELIVRAPVTVDPGHRCRRPKPCPDPS